MSGERKDPNFSQWLTSHSSWISSIEIILLKPGNLREGERKSYFRGEPKLKVESEKIYRWKNLIYEFTSVSECEQWTSGESRISEKSTHRVSLFTLVYHTREKLEWKAQWTWEYFHWVGDCYFFCGKCLSKLTHRTFPQTYERKSSNIKEWNYMRSTCGWSLSQFNDTKERQNDHSIFELQLSVFVVDSFILIWNLKLWNEVNFSRSIF